MRKSLESFGDLYVVATPIGNLEDMTMRAGRVLSIVDYIAAEDTRRTKTLLRQLGVNTRTRAYHNYNEELVSKAVISDLKGGLDIALVSDAGTPQVSDPGYHLVKQAFSAGIRVIPIPGPSALSAAISVSGVPTTSFLFEGFLPSKGKKRQETLERLAREKHSVVLYEAPHRIISLLDAMSVTMGQDRDLTIARELTKLHEQVCYGTLGSILAAFENGTIPCRGEFVIVVEGKKDKVPLIDIGAEHIMRELIRELPLSKAADVASRLVGQSRKSLYAFGLELKNKL